MNLTFHPSAEINFNDNAEKLIDLIGKSEESVALTKKSFVSEREPSVFLSEEDFISREYATESYRGEIVARHFDFQGENFGINKDKYSKVVQLASAIQKLPNFRDSLSCEYIEKAIFSWLKERFSNNANTGTFTQFLLTKAESDIVETKIWVPIANCEVETSFSVAGSEIRPISKKIVDEWSDILNKCKDSDRNEIDSTFKHIREEYQGLAAVVSTIVAEPTYVRQKGIEKAQIIVSLLGIFSGGELIPDIKCITNLKGAEHVAVANAIFEFNRKSNGQFFKYESFICENSTTRTMRLSQKDIEDIRLIGLDKLSLLLTKDSLTAFEEKVLHSVLLYSKASFVSDPIEKIIYILTSLESLLLKSETEPIKQNLSDRFSIFYGKNLTEKKELVKIIKGIYGIRSKYLHHGHSKAELEFISNFLWHVRLFYLRLLHFTDEYLTKEEFLSAIDDEKYK